MKQLEETRARLEPYYSTRRGRMYNSTAEAFLESDTASSLRGKVQLVLTSPPFPLKRKKAYGNLTGETYLEWLAGFAPLFRDLLRPDGSIVMELGNSWERGQPIMSTLPLRAMLEFLERGGLFLCESFVCYNPARLPSPAQWVNVERIRVKDAFTHVWWTAPSERPKADNTRVLNDYSKAMRALLSRERYNAGTRPSQHRINKKTFLKDNGGSIPPNVLKFANTMSHDGYLDYCRVQELPVHPARMPPGLPDFFIKFLTDPGDTVLDPFSGSNVTGAVAEHLGREWLAIEPNTDYVRGSMGRFSEVQESI